jgi:hypothetical protein
MASRPTSADAGRRLVILRLIVGYAMAALPRRMVQGMLASGHEERIEKFKKDAEKRRDDLIQFLNNRGLWNFVSPVEREIFSSTSITMTDQQQINASWRLESAQVLAWALRMISQIPDYDSMAESDSLKSGVFPKDPAEFIASARLRPEREIDRQRYVAEMWHWRSRTRQLIESGKPFLVDASIKADGFRSYDDIVRACAARAAANRDIPHPVNGDFPAMGKAYRDLTDQEWSKVTSITIERHFALNWLCGYSRRNLWDDTPTDT